MSDLFQFSRDYLDYNLAGATLQTWLLLLAAWLIISVVLLLIHRVLSSRAKAFAGRTANHLDDVLTSLINQTRAYFLVGLALMLATVLLLAGAETATASARIGHVVFIVFLVQVIIWGNGLINVYVERYRQAKLATDPAAVTTMNAVGFLARLLLWVVVFLLALDNLGVNITALVAGLGIGGIAVALAVQNILADLFASLSIVLDKPFAIGDFLIIDTYMGSVEHVGLKTTRLRSLSGEELVFANSDLLKSRIRNYKRMYERRIVFQFGVTYQTRLEQLKAIPVMVRDFVEQQPMVRFDRAHFQGFGDSALNFEVVYYMLAPEYNLYMDTQQAINLAIFERFEQDGIEFAYPTQTLFVEKLPKGAISGVNGGDAAP
ncbi:MAG TPA: mechanosensitive ion channel family protein [Rhodothermales bacterium]|nr:mechanosensitive ion channel family protein [Rhodothermales bacterium]